MMEKEKLRRADFVTSVVLLAVGGFILGYTFTMPMKDSWGGVMNVWYVSPALLPLFIGAVIITLSAVLLAHSIRSGGARGFFERLKAKRRGISEANVRFLAILLSLFSFVYLTIPRVDFFLCILWFLLFLVPVFHFDDMGLLRKMSVFYLAGNLLILLIFLSGLNRPLLSVSRYTVDVIVLLLIVSFWIFTRLLVRTDPLRVLRLRVSVIIALAVPLMVVPIFKYGLLVPLPHEGGIIGLMNLVRFGLF